MLTDTHCHLDDEKLYPHLDEVIGRAREHGMPFILNPGCDYTTSEKALEIAHRYPEVYAGAGFHPLDVDKYEGEKSLSFLRSLSGDEKMLAIGEIGLDYHYDDAPGKDDQKKAFEEQLVLAGELGLPVIIHDREAHKDTMDRVRSLLNQEASGVFHAYSGSVEMAREILDLGMMISLGGALTFKNARKTPDVMRYVPLDRVMLETDAPYMAPVPLRGSINEPANTRFVAQKMAEIKGVPVEEIVLRTAENAKRLFKVEF